MAERKSKALFGRQIREALKKDQLAQLRSEELPAFRPYFVDFQLLDQIHINSNQLIVGRRGTGKTHLLGAFNEMIRDDFPGEMSIMISMLEVAPRSRLARAASSADSTAREAAVALFESFLHVFLDKFISETARRMEFLRGSRAFTREQDAVANNLMERLLEAIELGTPMASRKSTSTTQTEMNDSGSNAGLQLKVGFKNVKPMVNLSAQAGTEREDGQRFERKTEIESQLSIDTYEVRGLLCKILDALHISTLYILIDEWMELDKKTGSGIQPIFAQLLKAVFFNTGRLAVKIASVWNLTALYDRADMATAQGAELKHDIVKACDLDTEFMESPAKARAFCKGILFKRLANICPKLKALERKGEIDDVFVTELFDNDDNFRAFITASHGIPRDIMMIFQKCALLIKRDFEKHCISHDLIFDVAKHSYMADKRRSIDGSSAPQRLLSAINTYMETTDQRVFLVENEEAEKSRALRKLVDEELIHQIPSAVTPRKIKDSHKTFLIDFGNFIDWASAKHSDLSKLLSETVLPQFPEDFDTAWTSYVIGVGNADEEFMSCKSCKRDVPRDHPVLVKFQSCPYCAEVLRVAEPQSASNG